MIKGIVRRPRGAEIRSRKYASKYPKLARIVDGLEEFHHL